jgi:DNA invertase Pin-like site-specific DNA recombinase
MEARPALLFVGNVLVIMERLVDVKAGFRDLTEAIDTTTPDGRMIMQMVGLFAEYQRAMLRELTQAGLDAAQQDGRIGGRRPKLSPQQKSEIRRMVSKGSKIAAEAARLFKVHPDTISAL